ncbi:helix-turn-helix domain-containing GNAT family N-acetyltransferase [Maritimibacter alkaliphilus]|uniref:helix-turn-helix domain-containing GNAT family N-acetyltransferase n=1 Tax=Maritimibacter alkaliphilus TaxID=404236 RepID=UPI001C970A69|nr:helix-turn-helix domain-containing GNAT family N-acetyltransferase [Maritimibacter alkaliphilus]MBY6089375.1 helix-turn-helix domain-containing GNAT family N-acetyltransferase [Maritimibacter alkaliphilus]
MSLTDISRVRRFSRAVTTETGALDQSFLGRGRPLGVARVLNAIGHGRGDVADLRLYLGLDSGQLSRILRGLEEEGLITTETAEEDARRRVAVLTGKGSAEFAEYEALSNANANSLLSRHPDPDKLLEAMDFIASALTRDRITIELADPESPHANWCLDRYFDEVNRLFKQGFERAKTCDPQAPAMRPPVGAFLLALSDGLPIGCVALKGTDQGYAEVKRLWIAPSARGLGLSKRMMQETEREARRLGIGTLRLDTNEQMPAAIALYEKTGWARIERFNDDPYPTHFFEKKLT